ncbi:hypothetical protein LTR62_000630 [Meristemomyces frigidus]|uniref:Uncharacterized protein n=1 Tax=Meristemomyces frigidus TaxID=1508187 RepID=A0AAN7T8P7_9PEZI|nr:hypothetical protein LTR62_000630 [Meristemomyces frigidus]
MSHQEIKLDYQANIMASQTIMHQPLALSHDPDASIDLNNFHWGSVDTKVPTHNLATPAAHHNNKRIVLPFPPGRGFPHPVGPVTAPDPPLGVLSAFNGSFSGTGLSLIFRPNSGPPQGTVFANPITPAAPTPPSENVLEINLTTETLQFSNPLGSVPNRGLEGQQDIFLNGVPYMQTVNDVTNFETGQADGIAQGIHAEPGVWMHVPSSSDPAVDASLVRVGSIPHGTTINAQCLESSVQTFASAPVFPKVNITPFVLGSSPAKLIPFVSQRADNVNSPRIPQDLTKFIAAGTITQGTLDDPNTVLAAANAGKTIVQTRVFTVSTAPADPALGGGVANIAFLSDPGTNGPNANAASMTATFWVNTVQTQLQVPTLRPGQEVKIAGPEPHAGARVPVFAIKSSKAVEAGAVVVTHTEVQYSQQVNLNFAGLTWPHVSVATLVPTMDLEVPDHILLSPMN